LHLNVYTTEHQVVLAPDIWRIISFDEGEVGTHVVVEYHIGIICENPVTGKRTLLPEVDLVGLTEARDLVETCFYGLLAGVSP